MQSSEIELLDDTVCELGEGPAYDPLSDTLFWLDIAGKGRHGLRTGILIYGGGIAGQGKAGRIVDGIDGDREAARKSLIVRRVEFVVR